MHVITFPESLPQHEREHLLRFFEAITNKFASAREKRISEGKEPDEWRIGFNTVFTSAREWSQCLIESVAKGDPIDVAVFCSFFFAIGRPTSLLNYISMTPELEAATRLALSVEDPKSLQPQFTVEDFVAIPTKIPLLPEEQLTDLLNASVAWDHLRDDLHLEAEEMIYKKAKERLQLLANMESSIAAITKMWHEWHTHSQNHLKIVDRA